MMILKQTETFILRMSEKIVKHCAFVEGARARVFICILMYFHLDLYSVDATWEKLTRRIKKWLIMIVA